MQAIKKLALKSPLKLRVIEVTGVQFEVIGVHRDRRVPEIDDDLDSFALGLRGERKQRMLVQSQLLQDKL